MTASDFRSLLKRFGVLAALLFAASLPAQAAGRSEPGAVYALTNSAGGNAVIAWHRSADGSLSPAGTFPTGGAGTGAGLGSQDAVVVSKDRRFLLAVNAGSNSVSSFRIEDHGGLSYVDTVDSGGAMPTSIALRGSLVYVLNAGVPNNVSGFHLADSGALTPIADSARPLSDDSTAPGQVGFSRDGDTLIVTERGTNRIDTYLVNDDGTLHGPFVFRPPARRPSGSRRRNAIRCWSRKPARAAAHRPTGSTTATCGRSARW